MEINFKTPELSDKPSVDAVLHASDKRVCELTFGNLFCWGGFYDTKLWCDGKTLVTGNPDKKRFSVPVGENRQQIIDLLINTYGNVRFSSIDDSDKHLFDDRFEITEITGFFDYIYTSESLRELRGKKLASKRNHINAFLSDGEWYTEHITPDDIPELVDFNKKWCTNRCDSLNRSLDTELCAVKMGLENFEALGYTGLKLYKNDTLVAYSYGEPINHDTFCVHVEKADDNVRGAYQMINREFAREFCAGFEYINREDDAGDEGLRLAKLSYRPTDLGKKYAAIYKEGK